MLSRESGRPQIYGHVDIPVECALASTRSAKMVAVDEDLYRYEKAYRTKLGKPIEFKVMADGRHEQKPEHNRGWVLHLIEAHVEGKLAGYLKISYIPGSRFDELYGGPDGIWAYARRMKGYCGVNLDSRNELWKSLTPYFGRWNTDLSQTDERIESDLKRWENRLRPDFENFKTAHRDRPFVDYVEVEGPDRETGRPGFRGQGVATAMYEFAADWIAREKGLLLHAGGPQSELAQKMWEHFEANGFAKKYRPLRVGSQSKHESGNKLVFVTDGNRHLYEAMLRSLAEKRLARRINARQLRGIIECDWL